MPYSFKHNILKNLDKNEYVCQTMTYPNEQKICTFETKNGFFITPSELPYGNYQIEELDQKLDNYLWNKEPLKFSINQDSHFIYDDEFGVILEVQFKNQEVKGKVNIKNLLRNIKFLLANLENRYYYAIIALLVKAG